MLLIQQAIYATCIFDGFLYLCAKMPASVKVMTPDIADAMYRALPVLCIAS